MKLKNYLLSGLIISAAGCGSDPENVGLDDDDRRDSFYSEKDGSGADNIWTDVVTYLGQYVVCHSYTPLATILYLKIHYPKR